MKRFTKKTLAWLTAFIMLLTMSTGWSFAAEDAVNGNAVGEPAAVEEQADQQVQGNEAVTEETGDVQGPAELGEDPASLTANLTFISASGGNVTITAAEIEAVGATVVPNEPGKVWKYNTNNELYGTFYSLKAVLENKGIDCSEAHGLKAVATDGFVTAYSSEEINKLYIYDQSQVINNGTVVGAAGTYGFGINDTTGDIPGNKWAKSVASIQLTNSHVWLVKKGKCQHNCSICGATEPGIQLGENTVYDCQIKAAESVEATADNPWTYTGKGQTNTHVGHFYKLQSILENNGVETDGIHGITAVASDGFTTGYSDISNVYVYDQGEVIRNGAGPVGAVGTYGTAVNGSAGNKWAKSVAAINVVNTHTPFYKGDKEYSYCAICGEELFLINGVYYTLQELVTAAEDGATVNLTRDVEYSNGTVLDLGGKTIILDIGENSLSAPEGKTFTVKNGTLKIKGSGTISAQLATETGASVKAEDVSFAYELAEEYCADGYVPVYDSETGLYTISRMSAYDSQTASNLLKKTIDELKAQINELNATITVNDVNVTAAAKATAYNNVKLTWECDSADDIVFKVQEKKNGEWTVLEGTEGRSSLDCPAEPGIKSEFRVAAGVEYDTGNGMAVKYGKYVSVSATPVIAKAGTPSVTTKSKKLTVKWTAVAGADSYDVYIGTNSSVTKGLVKYNNVKTTAVTSKTLKKNKYYYVKVRAHVKNSEGTVVYGSWSSAKKIKCK